MEGMTPNKSSHARGHNIILLLFGIPSFSINSILGYLKPEKILKDYSTEKCIPNGVIVSSGSKSETEDDPERQRKMKERAEYAREKKEQLKALLGTSRQNTVDDSAASAISYPMAGIRKGLSRQNTMDDSAGTHITFTEGTGGGSAGGQSELSKLDNESIASYKSGKSSVGGATSLSNCPFKPARGRSYIVEDDAE